ncbi:MAG: class I SAM-dependent methyltransferase [Eubacteriaceae bacterium]
MELKQWIRKWEEEVAFAPKEQRIKDNINWIKYWDFVAKEESEVTEKTIAESVCDFLEKEGVLNKEGKVLDIGAGDGKYSLLFSKKVAEVVALDMSKEMLERLEKEIKKEKIPNLKTCLEMFEKYQSKEKFDLVFASLCPGICDPESIDKMEALSKKYCVLITVAKNSRTQFTRDLGKKITDSPLTGHAPEIIYPFNYLYAKGKQPNLKHFPVAVHPKATVEDGVKTLQAYFEIFGFSKEKTETIIRDYLEDIAVDGIFMEEETMYLAILYWEV